MKENISKRDLERKIFQTTFADLANSDKSFIYNEVVEFKDIKMSFELFKHLFYDNNYTHFNLNDQYRYVNEISIDNKIIKEPSLYKNYVGGTKVNIIDILTLKYIENKKTKLDEITKIALVKDFNRYNTLLDFKIYKNHLGLDDILNLFSQYYNKNKKKYFRFKIKTTYYSIDLDESITMYFNYLVKIPKNINSKKSTSDNDFFDELDMNNEVENIVYSNYIKKLNDELLENAEDHLEDDPKVDPKVDDLVDDPDDDNDSITSDSNITVSSFENNNSNDSNDSFF